MYIDLVGHARSRRYVRMEAGAITNPPVTKEPNIVALFVTCPRFGRVPYPTASAPFVKDPLGR